MNRSLACECLQKNGTLSFTTAKLVDNNDNTSEEEKNRHETKRQGRTTRGASLQFSAARNKVSTSTKEYITSSSKETSMQ